MGMNVSVSAMQDQDIDLLSRHSELLGAYLYGIDDEYAFDWLDDEEIEPARRRTPDSWPRDGHDIVSTDITSVLTELYHLSLTGSLDPTDGPQGLFQAFLGHQPPAGIICLLEHSYAVHSENVPNIVTALNSVRKSDVENAIQQFVERHRRTRRGIEQELNSAEILAEFARIAEVANAAQQSESGLYWSCS